MSKMDTIDHRYVQNTSKEESQSDVPEETCDDKVYVSEGPFNHDDKAVSHLKRLQITEQNLKEIKGEFQDTKVELEQARQIINQLEQRQKIDELLAGSNVIDIDVARLLTESAIGQMEKPDIKVAINELRGSKPYLFRGQRRAMSCMSARSKNSTSHQTEQAANRAAVSGNRRDLLRYLRLRRQT